MMKPVNLKKHDFVVHLLLEKGRDKQTKFLIFYNSTNKQSNSTAVFSYQHLSSVGMKS